MIVSRLGALVAVVGTLALGAGCTDLGVGRQCLHSGTVSGTQISAPALECMSKLCYLNADPQGNLTRSVCTARCNADSDCAGANLGKEPLCPTGFVCAVASTVDIADSTEQFACQTLCLCKTDLTTINSKSDGTPCCPRTPCAQNNSCPAWLPACPG